MTLRADLIRIASSLPQGSAERRQILGILAAERRAVLSRDVLEVWQTALEAMARDLDLTDAEGRSSFRLMVSDRARHARTDLLRGLAAALKRPVAGSASRHVAARAIADAWISGNRLL